MYLRFKFIKVIHNITCANREDSYKTTINPLLPLHSLVNPNILEIVQKLAQTFTTVKNKGTTFA